MARLRIGSRGSALALWQANHISALLRAKGHEVELEIIKTTGDKITDVALAKVGTKGMFTKEIEEALVEGRVDLAVHSLKDLPTELAPEFEIAAITKREDTSDAFCSKNYASVDDLPQATAEDDYRDNRSQCNREHTDDHSKQKFRRPPVGRSAFRGWCQDDWSWLDRRELAGVASGSGRPS